MSERLGIHLSQPLPPERVVALSQAAEALGYERLVVSDFVLWDPFAVLSACAAATDRIGLGTAMMPIYERHPVSAAAAVASLAALAPGRVTFGVGTGQRGLVEGMLGADWRAPLSHLREYVGIVRALHMGIELRHSGEFYRVNTQLPAPHAGATPIVLGPQGPKHLAFAGAEADGVVIKFGTPHSLAERIAEIDRARRAVGRAAGAVEIACSLWCAVTVDRAETQRRRDDFRARVAIFARTDVIRARFRSLGFGQDMDQVEAAIEHGGAIDPLIGDDLIDAIAVIGDIDHCRSRLAEYRAGGVDLPLLVPIAGPSGDAQPVMRTLESLAS